MKSLVLRGKIRFTIKAKTEMRMDDIDPDEVIESIVSARSIAKALKSRSPVRENVIEKLYVIKGLSYQGTPIYTKGKIAREGDQEVFYVLISAKLDSYPE